MKTNVQVDVSGIGYQVVNRLTGYKGSKVARLKNDPDARYLEVQNEVTEFMCAMHEEMSKISSIIGVLNTNNLVFVFDSFGEKSFRSKLFPEYKKSKSRITEKPFNVTLMKNCLQQYYHDLFDKGFKVSVCDGLEADDLMHTWCGIFPEDENVCIVTGDGDMVQEANNRVFLYHNVSKIVTIAPNFRRSTDTGNNTGLFEDTSEDDEINYFFKQDKTSFSDNDVYAKFFKTAVVKDPKLSLLEKILIGDTSDNIPSCFKYFTKNGVTEYGFTNKKFISLMEKFPDSSLESISTPAEIGKFVVNLSEIVGRPIESIKAGYQEKFKFNKELIDLGHPVAERTQRLNEEYLAEMLNMISQPNNNDFRTLSYGDVGTSMDY